MGTLGPYGLPPRAGNGSTEPRRFGRLRARVEAQLIEGFSRAPQLKGTLEHAIAKHIWIPLKPVFLDLMSGKRGDCVALQDLLAITWTGAIAAALVLHTSRCARTELISRRDGAAPG
ncbi:MAG: hypothetical protein EXR61_04050 [Chloroflexi bacterium]|nr:hypothetical protein [Chloroflexota bacterium]